MFAWPHVFSVDDLSLPDPLSTPFHTARIYQSSISGELAAFHWGNIHFRHEPLYGNIVTVSAVIFLFGCPSCLNIIFNFMLPPKYVSYDPIAAKTARPLDSPGVVVTDESGKEAPGFAPPHPDTSATAAGAKDDAAPWRRPGSLRARPTTRCCFVVRRNYIYITCFHTSK